MPEVIRPARETDAEAIWAIYRPVVLGTAVSFEIEPPDAEEMRRRITSGLADLPWLVYERNGQLVGYAYASPFRSRPAYRWTVESSVYVVPTAWRQGIARKLCTSLMEILRVQGFHTVLAAIALPNPASVALHEHLGFRSIGVFHSCGYKAGAWIDVGWWERPLGDWPANPALPKPFREIINSRELWNALDANRRPQSGLATADRHEPR